MARFKSYDYKQRIMIPVSLDEQIMAGTLEYAVQELVENRLVLSPFNEKYRNDDTQRPAINPKILLKVVLLPYSRGIVGSRKIERLMREHQKEDSKDSSSDSNGPGSPDNFNKGQIERLKRTAERIEKFLSEAKPRIGKQKVELKSNVIDTESAKMVTSHGVIQGYNAQAIVDDKHQIIVAGLASGEGNDTNQVSSLLPQQFLYNENRKRSF